MWKELSPIDTIPQNRPVSRSIGKREFLVVRNGDTVAVCGGICPHNGVSLFAGSLDGEILICPCHHGRFNLQTGKNLTPPAMDPLTVYANMVEEGVLYVGKPLSQYIAPTDVAGDEVYVIIGGGPAGLSCAESLRNEGFLGQVVIISEEIEPPYDRTRLSKSFSAKKDDLAPLLRDPDYLAFRSIQLLSGLAAVQIDPEGHKVILSDGRALTYTNLCIATGAVAAKLDIPGNHLRGVCTLRSLDDGVEFSKLLKDATNVVVVGAGFVGLESAAAIRDRGLPVSIVAPEALPMETVLGPEIAAKLVELHGQNGVQWKLGKSVVRVLGSSHAEGVELADGGILQTDLVLFAVGARPATGFLGRSVAQREHSIVVNEGFCTNRQDIYAAGDVATFPHPMTGVPTRIGHWTTAVSQGKLAALSMLGKKQAYREVPFFWSEQYTEIIKAVGICDTDKQRLVIPGKHRNRIFVGFFAENRLTGAAGIGFEKSILQMDILLTNNRAVNREEVEKIVNDNNPGGAF